jgi:hypothetical protein
MTLEDVESSGAREQGMGLLEVDCHTVEPARDNPAQRDAVRQMLFPIARTEPADDRVYDIQPPIGSSGPA